MENLNKILEKAVEALEDNVRQITRKESMSPAELEHLSKSICTIERIKNIQRENGEDYATSENSYRRGRSRTTGQYVSRDGSGNSNRGYYDGGSNNSSRYYDGGNSNRYYDSSGYSGHSIKDRMIARLEEMFDEAQSEHEKQVVQDWLDRLSSR